MTKILNFGSKIKGGSMEGGTCEVLRPCHPPKKKLKRAQSWSNHVGLCSSYTKVWWQPLIAYLN